MATLCELLKASRAGDYAWVARPPSKREIADGVLTAQIQDAFGSNRKVYGSPRIHAELVDADVHVGRKRVARWMRQAGIVGCHRRKHKLGSTKQNPAAAPAPDLVDRKSTATAPNQLWVADVTHVPTVQGWLYLACVTDVLFSTDPGLVDGLAPQDRPRRRRSHAVHRRGGKSPGASITATAAGSTALTFYNPRRRHSAIGQTSPAAFEERYIPSNVA